MKIVSTRVCDTLFGISGLSESKKLVEARGKVVHQIA